MWKKKELFRRAVLVWLLTAAFLLLLGISALASESGKWGNLNWKINDGGTLSISGSGDMDNFAGQQDRESAWRQYADKINEIIINPGVTSIGNYAFYKCINLRSITIPTSITSIGNNAFNRCERLTSITIPSSVTSIADDVFSDCKSLKTVTVTAKNKKYSSEDGVLFNKQKTELLVCPCGKAGEYIIPDEITSISGGAFSGCCNLTSITIPKSLTGILIGSMFNGCDNLQTITVASKNSKYSSSGGVLYNKARTKLICCPPGKEGRYKIPDSVTIIGEYAFYNCRKLDYIIIPHAVTNIDYNALDGKMYTDPDSNDHYTYFRSIIYDGSETEWNKIQIDSWVDDNALVLLTGFLELLPGTESINAEEFVDIENMVIKIPASVAYISEKAFSNKVLIWCKSESYAKDRCVELGLPYIVYFD